MAHEDDKIKMLAKREYVHGLSFLCRENGPTNPLDVSWGRGWGGGGGREGREKEVGREQGGRGGEGKGRRSREGGGVRRWRER